MEQERTHASSSSSSSKGFFQDTQKLTFALGLTTGLAVMAIVGLILVAVNKNGSSTSSATTEGSGTPAAAGSSDTAAAATGAAQAQFDPVAIAASVGIDESKFKSCLDSKKYTARVDKDLSDGNSAGVNGTPTSFVNGTAISGAIAYSEIKSAIDAALKGTKGTAQVPEVKKDDHVIGAKKPKVYIVEYSDFQCPFCKRFSPTLKQALDEYKNDVALVYRHFPLESIHPYARSLAEGSECANELGGGKAFWEFHDKVFEG